MHRSVPWFAAALLLAGSPVAASAGSDWSAWADLETVSVVTADAGGAERETTIWVVVLDGTAYIRTSESSPWGDEVEQASRIGLRGGDELRQVAPSPITDTAQRERVTAAFREKYGFQDALISVFRGEARIWSVAAASS